MAHAVFFLAAALAVSGGEPPAQRRGAELASAQVTVRILHPAIVRQGKGLEPVAPHAPSPQVTRRAGQVLIEYE
jgi:hypothetical protein